MSRYLCEMMYVAWGKWSTKAPQRFFIFPTHTWGARQFFISAILYLSHFHNHNVGQTYFVSLSHTIYTSIHFIYLYLHTFHNTHSSIYLSKSHTLLALSHTHALTYFLKQDENMEIAKLWLLKIPSWVEDEMKFQEPWANIWREKKERNLKWKHSNEILCSKRKEIATLETLNKIYCLNLFLPSSIEN